MSLVPVGSLDCSDVGGVVRAGILATVSGDDERLAVAGHDLVRTVAGVL